MSWARPLDDRRLADAGLADEHRVVLRTAGQDLHDPLDLLLAPDDRVELALAGVLGQVAAELVEHQRRRRRVPPPARRGADATTPCPGSRRAAG
jgi:hypothetical protein